MINIEREANLGGKIHNKGVLILSGYLRGIFGRVCPMNINVSICFEQSYGEVEGDSASSTELYAILSAMSDVPIRQDIAVTGSVNQRGEVQAIGGLNEKIEGFYDVCRTKGLTGKQGVLVPQSNVQDLMLRKDLQDAVKAQKFHVWPIKHVDEGIEILTGVKAGKLLKSGKFEKGSINYLIEKKLEDIEKKLKELSGEEKKSNNNNNNKK